MLPLNIWLELEGLVLKSDWVISDIPSVNLSIEAVIILTFSRGYLDVKIFLCLSD